MTARDLQPPNLPTETVNEESLSGEDLARTKLPEALHCLSELLRYASEENYMNSGDAVERALHGMRAINDVLARINRLW